VFDIIVNLDNQILFLPNITVDLRATIISCNALQSCFMSAVIGTRLVHLLISEMQPVFKIKLVTSVLHQSETDVFEMVFRIEKVCFKYAYSKVATVKRWE